MFVTMFDELLTCFSLLKTLPLGKEKSGNISFC